MVKRWMKDIAMDIPLEKKTSDGDFPDRGYAAYGPWSTTPLPQDHEPIRVMRSENPPLGHPLFVTDVCSSTMDLAWILHSHHCFPEWSSILSVRQERGRGQFKRTWISPVGNLYATLRLATILPDRSLISMVAALAVQSVLGNLGLYAEFKWPNDLLVSRKKVGGILVEERGDTVIAGIGINMSQSPPLEILRDLRALPSTHLEQCGISLAPLEIWSLIVQAVKDHMISFFHGKPITWLVKELEHHMAFMGERVVFKPHHGDEFPAVIEGLSETGGIRLKTPDGEKIWHSGGFFPVIY